MVSLYWDFLKTRHLSLSVYSFWSSREYAEDIGQLELLLNSYPKLNEASETSEAVKGQVSNTRSEIDAEIASLPSKTDMYAFKRLDDLVEKIERAGLMEEYETKLNEVADYLTVLLAEAEKRIEW